MEQEKKKLNSKVIIQVVAIVVALVIGIFIGRATMTSKGITEKDCIGTWKNTNKDNDTITIYQGGTGQFGKGTGGYSLTWEIKDNILNITYSGFTEGFDIEKDKMVSVNGKDTYIKVK